ncbi:hypothetical protein J2T15_004512 [Paenibacillus harenae]|uniref:Uncharacterized protein n=1 Tax=Paenibacillus harenae TaxID=306543 RepID=A0ABT9U5Y0_PAEHA|nr:hypothetical protein [Paenibacillus harenae]
MIKQELGFEHCHSTSESHQHAHLELVFTTESLLAYALWQINKEKTSDDDVEGLFKHRFS